MIGYEGSEIWPERGFPTLNEIAVGLGRQARWGGQTREWYPVLAHSIVVAHMTTDVWKPYALLHDAHEAILGDTVTTWKSDDRQTLEDRLQRRILESLGLPEPTAEGLEAVSDSDATALAAEAHVLGHVKAEKYWPLSSTTPGDRYRVGQALIGCRRFLNAPEAIAELNAEFEWAMYRRAKALLVPV